MRTPTAAPPHIAQQGTADSGQTGTMARMSSWAENLTHAVTDKTSDSPPLDVGDFLGKVGSTTFGPQVLGPERSDSADEVELLEGEPAKLTGTALDVDAFIDGIQSSQVITWRQSRPVVMAYTAAGAACQGPDLAGLVERLFIVASQADGEWLDSINTQSPALPTILLDDLTPPEVDRVAAALVRSTRDACERQLATLMLQAGATRLLVDGDLQGRPVDDRIVGVVKTVATRFLRDEEVLWTLPAGWRSPMFRIPSTGGSDRYSCYVRLQPFAERAWDHGLIRIEAFTPELLEPLGALTLLERQEPGSQDPRWDRHLLSVRICEQLLRDRRPLLF